MCKVWKMYKKLQHFANSVKLSKVDFRDASASQKSHHCTLDQLARFIVILTVFENRGTAMLPTAPRIGTFLYHLYSTSNNEHDNAYIIN